MGRRYCFIIVRTCLSPYMEVRDQPCAISALSTFTWVLRLRLGPPGAAQPSHYPPFPRQQNGSHSLLVQGSFVALSQSSLCKGPSVSLSFMDKRVHPGCVCVWVFKPRRGVATSRTWDKVTESSLLSGKLAGRKAVALGLRSDAYRIQHFGAECQLQLAGEGLFPVFESAVLEGSWGHSFYSQ